MAIVSSSYVSDTHAQTGGGVWTTETHTDSDGVTYVIGPYLWDGTTDRDTLLTVRATRLAETLAALELEQLIKG